MLLAAGSTPAYLPELTALVVGGAVVAYFGFRAGLVPIVAFLLTGALIGPNQLGLVRDLETVNAAAEVGVLLLLFTIGLEFSLDRLNELRRALFVGGGLQVSLTTALTTGVLVLAGVGPAVALFSGLLVALSSTAIVLKLLAERGEMNAPHGKLAVSVLLFQDLAVVAMVLLVPALGTSGGSASEILLALATAVAVIALVVVVARRALPPVLERIAATCSPELFLLSVVAMCIGTAYLTSLAGISVSLGAFLAGLVFAESRFSSQALGEVVPLQILFSAVFFVSIGMLLDVGFLLEHLPVVLGAVLALLVVKAVCATAAMLALGERLAVALAAGLVLAQVGEFSFVLATVGRAEGLTPAGLGEDGTQAFIAATVLLMAATPALATLGVRLSSRVTAREGADEPRGRDTPEPGSGVADHLDGHVLIAGYGQAARAVSRVLRATGVEHVVATLSPDGASHADRQGVPVLLGDPLRALTLTEAGIERAGVVVIADDTPERAAQVARVVRNLRPEAKVLIRTRYAVDLAAFDDGDADAVVAEEVEASAALAAKVLEHYDLAPDAAAAHARGVDGFYRESGDAPSARRSRGNARIDTEATVAIALDGAGCEHAGRIVPVVPGTNGCEECLRSGDSWVHLRLCLSCGKVGCCDSSPNRHARAHYEDDGHPIVRSAEPGESWVYCLADERELASATDP